MKTILTFTLTVLLATAALYVSANETAENSEALRDRRQSVR